MEEKLREEMKKIIETKNPEEILDIIKKRTSESEIEIEFGTGKLLTVKEVIRVTHPVINRLLDYGNITKDLNSNTRVKEILKQIVQLKDSTDKTSLENLVHLTNELVDKVKDTVVDFTLRRRVLEAEEDLRPAVIPASVGRDEIPNIYLRGESYNRDDRMILAYKLLRSIPVGRNISIFLEGDFHNYLKMLLRRKLNKTELTSKDIKSSEWELSQPYVTLTRLLVWLRNELWDEMLRDNIVELMRSSSGVIYFDSYVHSFPQLNRFVEIWLEKEGNKVILEGMLDSIMNFSNKSYGIGKKAVEGKIELLYSKLNFLTMRLIEGSNVEWESVRRIFDSIIDIIETLRKQGQEVKANLYFISQLARADFRGSAEYTA